MSACNVGRLTSYLNESANRAHSIIMHDEEQETTIVEFVRVLERSFSHNLDL